jgi:hypothetical protein
MGHPFKEGTHFLLKSGAPAKFKGGIGLSLFQMGAPNYKGAAHKQGTGCG